MCHRLAAWCFVVYVCPFRTNYENGETEHWPLHGITVTTQVSWWRIMGNQNLWIIIRQIWFVEHVSLLACTNNQINEIQTKASVRACSKCHKELIANKKVYLFSVGWETTHLHTLSLSAQHSPEPLTSSLGAAHLDPLMPDNLENPPWHAQVWAAPCTSP